MPLFSLKYVLRTKSEMPSSVSVRLSMPSLRSSKAIWLRSSPSVSGSYLLSKAKRPLFQSRLPTLYVLRPTSIRASRATSLSRFRPRFSVSPGRCTFTSVRVMLRLSALMIHFTSDAVVSTAAVSLRAMSRRASESRAPFTSIVSLSRSIPFEASHNSSSSPLMRRSLIKPLVLIFA